MRDRRFCHAEQRCQIADTELVLFQRMQDPDAGAVAEQLEQRSERNVSILIEKLLLHRLNHIRMNDFAFALGLFLHGFHLRS